MTNNFNSSGYPVKVLCIFFNLCILSILHYLIGSVSSFAALDYTTTGLFALLGAVFFIGNGCFADLSQVLDGPVRKLNYRDFCWKLGFMLIGGGLTLKALGWIFG